MKKAITLRLRITLLVGIILALITAILTVFSIKSAQHYFAYPQLNKSIQINSSSLFSQEPDSSIISNNHDNTGLDSAISAIAITEAQEGFSTQSVAAMVFIIILGLCATYFIVGNALKPLTQLSLRIRDINEHNLNTKIEAKTSDDEMGSLTNSFNAMLERIKLSFENQKRFAANAAHELKTPLTTMKASLQVLKLDETPNSEDYKENLDAAEQSADRLIGIVNDLFLLSSHGKMELQDEISLFGLFEEIKQELGGVIQAKHIQFIMPTNDYFINGNKQLLQNAFFNIIENAIKYNKENGEVKVALNKLTGGKISISVTDTGTGITDECIPHIFEPFYRADKSRSQHIPGNGLGLSISKTIIEKHGGEILVKSIANSGTKVTVFFPYLY